MTVWHDFKTCAPEHDEELLLVKYHKARECIDDYFIYRCGFYCEDMLYLGSSSYYDYEGIKARISLEQDIAILKGIPIVPMDSNKEILDRVYWARLSDIENVILEEIKDKVNCSEQEDSDDYPIEEYLVQGVFQDITRELWCMSWKKAKDYVTYLESLDGLMFVKIIPFAALFVKEYSYSNGTRKYHRKSIRHEKKEELGPWTLNDYNKSEINKESKEDEE